MCKKIVCLITLVLLLSLAGAALATPNNPVLVAPPNGATGVSTSPTLTVTVSDPQGENMTVVFYGQRVASTLDEFTIIPLPDTQYYSEAFPNIYTAQTQWIVDSVASRNIVFVTHEGDIVEEPPTVEAYWINANASMSLLDGVVPYGVLPGNHDQPTIFYNQYFPYTRYAAEPWYGGHYPTTGNDNNYELISAGGVDFIILHLEYNPGSAVITWADGILKAYPDRMAIITTHAYLNGSGGIEAEGQTIWDNLVVPNDNVYFVLCGHNSVARRTDVVNGRQVHQIMADYQYDVERTSGYLRIMRFVPAEDKVYVETYSPWLGTYLTDAENQFTVELPMSWFEEIGTNTGVASGSNTSVTWSGLLTGRAHEWFVEVTDASSNTRVGPVWSFTTQGNQAPTAMADADVIGKDKTLNVVAPGVLGNDSDPEGGSLTAVPVSQPVNGSVTLNSDGSFTYTPDSGFTGDDSFTYKASDGVNQSNVATVTVHVQDIVGWWKFDDCSGMVAADSSGHFNDGRVMGPTWVAGHIGTCAMEFEGNADVGKVVAPATLNLNSNTVTITGWLKRYGDQGSAGVVFCKGGNTSAAVKFSGGTELRYQWNGTNWNWGSKLNISDNVWAFFALVVEPTRATIYRGESGVLSSAVNTKSHAIEEFNAPITIGADPQFANRYFKGAIDDVRIYNRSLSQVEINNIFTGGGAPDTTPPSPNPMTWATAPYATGSTSIAMVATTATDVSGVQYFFDCTSTGGHDSGWQTGTTYTDTGLSAGTQYCYRVQARDNSPNQNTTAWSTTQCATTQTGGDTTPPTPNPMTWATVPYATGSTSIAMTATTATDTSGVQYYFDCTSGAGHDSGWQSGTSYTDTGLSPSTQYCYRIQARDLSPNQNATTWSTTQCATTQTGDTTPPSPNPMTWSILPYSTGSSSIAMTATTATDPSGMQYYFDCTSGAGHDSGWQTGTTYTDTGLAAGTQYCYRVQARDNSPNQNVTGWSTTQCATTQTGGDTTPPSPNPMTWATLPYATGSTSIAMVATTATDASGVEYYFDETSGNPGGSDSAWQDSTSYTDTGLSPSTQYTYRVQARDKSANQNATGWSTSQSATTQSGGGENLALNKPVTVSSTEGSAVGANAVDGSLTTFWRSKKRGTLPSEWIKVDLGASYSISKVVLKWAGFWGTAYTIQVSTNDSTYTTVYSTSSGDGGDDVITFSSVSARYVKMDATGFYNNTERLRLNEYEVFQQ